MTQRIDSAHTPLRSFWLRSLLVQSLSWIGVLSLFSSNLVLAQVVVPTIEDSKPRVAAVTLEKSAPDKPQSAPAPAIREQLRQKLSPMPTSVRGERPRLADVSNSPAPVRRELLRQKLLPTPTSVKRERPRQEVSTSPTPQLSSKVSSVVKPPTNLPSPVQARPPQLLKKTATNPRSRLASTEYNNAYIDPTEYNIGATSSYEAPSRVVLSERSTGCKAVLRQGQGVSGSLCGTAPLLKTRVARRGTQSINTVRLPRPQAPSWVRRSRAVAVAGISPVRIGPISVNVSGFSATQRTPSSNRTLQPTEQPSNATTGLLFPLTVPAAITSLFGWRLHPITGNHRFHSGTDLGAPLGTPVLAAYTGHVAIADFLGGYGLTVVLDHNQFTQQTLYGHLSEISVQPGEWVKQGTVIGRVGSTGNSTGPHLHFETRQLTTEGWVATDPGAQLEYALAQLVQALQTTQEPQQSGSS